MRFNTINMILVLVVVLLGVGSFAVWTKSQIDVILPNEPKVFFIESGFDVPDEFRSKLEPESFAFVYKDEAPTIFPTEDTSLFVLKKGITDVDEIMDWARKNNQQEVYFYYTEDPPPDELAYFELSFDLFNVDNFVDFLGPEKAWADSMQGPNCSTGSLKPSGFSYSWACVSDTSPCDNCPGDGYKPGITVTFMYQHRDLCHGYPVTNHVNDNIMKQPETSHVTSLSSVGCFNIHNSGSPYMCYPVNTIVEMYNGTSTSTCGWNTNNDIWGCANVGSLTTPRKSIDKKIFMREGKFRNNIWLVRHEVQHNYGWTHGGGPGNCGSHGNTENQQHCCQTSNHVAH